MTTEKVEAIYEHGGFRLLGPVDPELVEGQKVRLVVEPMARPDEILAMAARVYEGLSGEDTDSIERHSRRREEFFGERPPE